MKEYKHVIIIDGRAYVLTKFPTMRTTSQTVEILVGDEFYASVPGTSSLVIIPYEDWVAGGEWAKHPGVD